MIGVSVGVAIATAVGLILIRQEFGFGAWLASCAVVLGVSLAMVLSIRQGRDAG